MATVQDMGRSQFFAQGVPLSGAMDKLSAQIANLAVGNELDRAVIEFTQGGAAFEVLDDILIALSGDGARLKTAGQILPADRPVFVPAGTEISLESNRTGSRTYVAIAGGWDVPLVLGSRSTYLPAKIGGVQGRRLKENDTLSSIDELAAISTAILDDLRSDTIRFPHWSVARSTLLPANRKIIRVIKGPEFGWFDDHTTRSFFANQYILTKNCDRMGYRLSGEPHTRSIPTELLSTAVAPGTIQVTNDGSLVLLMADCQTTGGYPRVAQVVSVDLSLCGQLKPGDAVNFTGVSWKEAEKLYIQQQLELKKIAAAIKFRYNTR